VRLFRRLNLFFNDGLLFFDERGESFFDVAAVIDSLDYSAQRFYVLIKERLSYWL
jgi:predicted double-glycine peptidase